ncbi:hypothetical protein Ga0074812_11159 [Parafrankia irregularis]|uniref:Uncharacterized protein n=1 Tax=Parafrankia irregularis TaxID=795642 RepID=A0A0S4QNK4_9ACTN|nr:MULTISPECIES: hypothetical protein [Parafrankia]MBE3204253.1 hypothetical protein [Parafrankia sp. CH37]CUU57223.1 hypothetical protein Ga0074812_11159 [Parafrankia irregularis]
MSPVLASNRAGNLVRALIIIAILVLIMRTAYLLWVFHTPAWTSRPHDVQYCGGWYERSETPDLTGAEARKRAGGRLKQVMRSPVLRPITAYKPGSACPRYIFAKVASDTYVQYEITDD